MKKESKSPTSAPARESTASQALRRKTSALGKSSVVALLRRITLAVQVFPFVYTALFVVLFTAYSFGGGTLLDIIDYAVFVSPAVILAHIVYSFMLRLCKWHRIACALPLIPQAADLFDTYVLRLDHTSWLLVSVSVIVTMTLFLIAIHKVFFS